MIKPESAKEKYTLLHNSYILITYVVPDRKKNHIYRGQTINLNFVSLISEIFS